MIANPGTLVLKSVKKPKWRDQEKVTKSKEDFLDHETRNIER